VRGWICPRCEVAHAPSVLRCECKAAEKEQPVPEWYANPKPEVAVPGSIAKALEQLAWGKPDPLPMPNRGMARCRCHEITL
jgi:hypothetical protein